MISSNPSVIISHSGKQHSYYVAKALLDLGFLETFYTSSYITNFSMQALVQKMHWSLWSRRFLPGLGGRRVNASWQHEIKELLYRRIKGNNQKANELVLKRDEQFDQALAARLASKSFNTYWGFQGSCLDCLNVCNRLGKETICEMTIAHLPFAKRILTEEGRIHPEWADSIDFANFPSGYERRLLEEPVNANRVVAISSFLKKTLVEEGIEAEKVSVIPLGFDALSVPFKSESKALDERPLRLLFAGRITQRKGIKYLLEAMRQFNKKDVELHVIGNIYGNGKAFRQYSSLYTYSKGISQGELFALYSNYDALVFPSILEGFGLVTIEAMGAGLPVITTPHTNATEVINNGVNGWIVPIRSSEAIAAAITKLRNLDNQAFQEMRYKARETALKYTWEAHRRNVEQFILSSDNGKTA